MEPETNTEIYSRKEIGLASRSWIDFISTNLSHNNLVMDTGNYDTDHIGISTILNINKQSKQISKASIEDYLPSNTSTKNILRVLTCRDWPY